jgi:hypothetical protein
MTKAHSLHLSVVNALGRGGGLKGKKAWLIGSD